MRKISFKDVLPNIIGVLIAIAGIVVFVVYKHPTLAEPWIIDESSAVCESTVSIKEDNINTDNGERSKSTFSPAGSANSFSDARSKGEKININTADLSELMSLEGIGEVKAKAIIEYREAHGGFSSISELTRVSGIGEKTLEKNRDRITV